MSSPRSRWIWSATRWLRLVDLARGMRSRSERAGDFLHFEDLELVLFLDVVVALQAQTALEPRLHFAHVVLEALERRQLAGPDHHVVAQQARARGALDHA